MTLLSQQIDSLFWLPFLVTAMIAGVVSPIVILFYKKWGWLDDPTTQTHPKIVHTYPVPRGGGLVILTALIVGIGIFLGIDKHSIGILAGAIIIGLVGILDDRRSLSPYWRLVAGFLAAGCVVIAGIGIAFITNPWGGGVIHLNQLQIPIFIGGVLHTIWVWSDLFALLWIVWCMNMLNWSKGVDGQLPGIVVVAAIVIGILSFRFTEDVTQWSVVRLAAITAGAYLGLLVWNFYPQKMMPGYGAGALSGYLLAILSILSGAKLATLILVLGVPMIDAIYVVINRLKQRRSPVWGDRGHFHHKLLDLGWGKRRVAGFYWLVTMILGGLALQLNARQKAFTIVLLVLTFGGILLWVNYFTTSSKQPGRDSG
jgi:UDP-GlcNAc:undecaprenyl-phosphate/decaprenyl-phosphate GlcNAc-1-phosphate transferase